MVVISLFDGISCGRIALEKNGIVVDKYYASEIEPNAIKVSSHNYPDIIQIGDVRRVSYHNGLLDTERGNFNIGDVDLVCAGSPCTNFSSIGMANGMVAGDVEILSFAQYKKMKEQMMPFIGQSYLFWEFVRILKEVKPKFFLLENVVMSKKWESIITSAVGVSPIKINSSVLSAQNRPRLYWTNIPQKTIRIDETHTLTSIIDEYADDRDVSYCLTVQRGLQKLFSKYGYIPNRFNAYNASIIKEKACALSRGSMITSSCATLLFVRNDSGVHSVNNGIMDGHYPVYLQDGRYNIRKLSLTEQERLQTLPDDYTNVDGVSYQKRSELIGNGWTVSVIQHLLSGISQSTI